KRNFFAAYPEHPAPAVYGETADADGQAAFKAALGKKFELLKQADPVAWIGVEESPYTQELLGITYPAFSIDTLIDRAQRAYHVWRKVSAQERAGILIESLERVRARF